jgi:hypothetical protein
VRLRAAIGLACAGLLVVPSAAQAAGTVTLGVSQVTFQAAAGIANDVTVTVTQGSATITDTADVITEAETNCDGTGTNTVTCTVPGLAFVISQLGDMNDRLQASGPIPQLVIAGEGDDELTILTSAAGSSNQVQGEEGSDRITTGDGSDSVDGGPGADTIATGAGDDGVSPGLGDGDVVDLGPGNDFAARDAEDGVDTFMGGRGVDRIAIFSPMGGPSVDVVADLAAGTTSGTNTTPATMTGFEDLRVFVTGTSILMGTPGSNVIDTGPGMETVDPGASSDFLNLGDGADRALTRDGYMDSVRCGGGVDSAEVDQLDATIGCENVAVAQVRPAGAGLDPPGCAIASVRSRITRRALLRRGLAAAVECARPASLEVRLLGRAAPRRGGIGAARVGDVVLAERSLPLAGGRRNLRLRVIRRLRAAILRSARLRLEVVARDEFGNAQVLTKRVRVTSPRVRSR